MHKRGQIGFSTHREKRLSKLIRWFTNHRFSHTFLISDVTDKQKVYLLDAYKKEVAFTPLRFYNDKDTEYELWEPIGVSDELVSEAMDKVELRYMKKPYSFSRLAGIAIKLAVKWKFGRVIKNPFGLGTICSDVSLDYLAEIMPDLFAHLDKDHTNPSDLYDIVAHSGRFTLVTHKDFK
jgi:hypothetical protein